MATKGKRRRYEIRETLDKDGIRGFLVGYPGQPDYERVGVWVSKDGTARCVDCQGRLTAMLASCPHARAASAGERTTMSHPNTERDKHMERLPVDHARPVGWISCGLRQGRDDRIVDIVFENAECAKAFIDGVEPVNGPIVAATAMRDRCVTKVNELTEPHRLAVRYGSGSKGQNSRAVIRFSNEVMNALRVLTFNAGE